MKHMDPKNQPIPDRSNREAANAIIGLLEMIVSTEDNPFWLWAKNKRVVIVCRTHLQYADALTFALKNRICETNPIEGAHAGAPSIDFLKASGGANAHRAALKQQIILTTQQMLLGHRISDAEAIIFVGSMLPLSEAMLMQCLSSVGHSARVFTTVPFSFYGSERLTIRSHSVYGCAFDEMIRNQLGGPVQPEQRHQHPAMVLVEDYLTPRGMSTCEAESMLEVFGGWIEMWAMGTQQLSVPMAIKIAHMTNEDPEYWLRLQHQYNLDELSRTSLVPEKWETEAPKTEGYYLFNCDENNYSREEKMVFMHAGTMVVDCQDIGVRPVQEYHDGLTEPKWLYRRKL